MRKILLTVIILGVLYFILGFIAVQFDWMAASNYNSYATIVGGVATLCGLITFVLPKISSKDIEILEIESLKRVAKIAEELNTKNTELNLKTTEITKLEQQKKELEFLVRKASLSLFLQDQIERNEKRVLEMINANQEILRCIEEIKLNREKLTALEEEIKLSDQVVLLEEIIYRARTESNQIELGFQGITLRLPNPLDIIYQSIRNIMR